jgi:hypothetical protein
MVGLVKSELVGAIDYQVYGEDVVNKIEFN